MTVSESSWQADSKTVPDLWIWWRIDWVIQGWRQSSIFKESIKVEEKLIFEMLSIVFNLKYLSQNFIKFKDQGQFWNHHDEQIPKLSLGVQFDQEIMEKTWETSCWKLTDWYCSWNVKCLGCLPNMHPCLVVDVRPLALVLPFPRDKRQERYWTARTLTIFPSHPRV